MGLSSSCENVRIQELEAVAWIVLKFHNKNLTLAPVVETMTMKISSSRSKDQTPDARRHAEELARFWLLPLTKLSWPERLEVLEKIDDEIGAIFTTPESHRKTSREFTARMVRDLGVGTVTCVEQAYVYLNSADDVHVNAARMWLVLNRPNSGILAASSAAQGGSDQRVAPRHEVDLPTVIAHNDNRISGKLVDVSVTGARIAVTSSLVKGTLVEIEVPHLGRVAACVMWVAASFVGLAFATQNMV